MIDTDTGEILAGSTLRTASFGARLAFGGDPGAPDTLYAVTRGNNALYVFGLDELGTLSCSAATTPNDGAACAVAASMGPDPFDVAEIERWTLESAGGDVDMRGVAVASLGDQLTFVTLRDGEVDTARVRRTDLPGAPNTMVQLTADDLLVAGRASNLLSVLTWYRDANDDVAGFVETRRTVLPNRSQRSEVRDIAVSSRDAIAWLSHRSPSGITRLDVSPDASGVPRARSVARWNIDGGPSDLVVVDEAGREVVYATLAESGEVAAIDGSTGVVLARIPVGDDPFAMAWDPVRHQRLWVALFGEDAVVGIDLDTTSSTFRQVVVRIGGGT
jgi:YVTN family beta-propeller protein